MYYGTHNGDTVFNMGWHFKQLDEKKEWSCQLCVDLFFLRTICKKIYGCKQKVLELIYRINVLNIVVSKTLREVYLSFLILL